MREEIKDSKETPKKTVYLSPILYQACRAWNEFTEEPQNIEEPPLFKKQKEESNKRITNRHPKQTGKTGWNLLTVCFRLYKGVDQFDQIFGLTMG